MTILDRNSETSYQWLIWRIPEWNTFFSLKELMKPDRSIINNSGNRDEQHAEIH